MTESRLAAVLIAWLAGAVSARAQTPTFDAAFGAWKTDSISTFWSVGLRRPLVSPLDYTLSISHVDDRRSVFDRTQTGAEMSLGLWRDGSGPYGFAGVGLGMRHYDGNLDASWSIGAGWALRVLSFLSVALESRYRTEDQFSRGFWRLDPTDRRGVAVSLRATLLGGASRRERSRAPAFDPPSPRDLERASHDGGELAADVVGTALDAMGTPYRWGGDGANGYDCSGLIQYAYGQHGIILPRVSREQARRGHAVQRRVDALRPGDILGFSIEGAGVTHVGLYIGEGQFIHSATAGVKLSSLTGLDPDSVWWQRRWVETRRILQ